MTIQNVTFKNKALDLRLAGQLYLPAEFDGTKNYAAIVVTGPMLSIKESHIVSPFLIEKEKHGSKSSKIWYGITNCIV